jgi:hypothetical protein
MESIPGFKSPEGEKTLCPNPWTESDVIVVVGTTLGWRARRSV